ncbi:aminoglycoside phosphotransferase [Kaistia sp. 32K]|uniref:phosphotransferase n=1 Tax=Kaistia sp. 32K TaxID=2795690 RepID=UPI001915C952|nr:phosphotransferase [Kaistia sp. 32K]BCP52355.1 aminoglycoside phosphotransferase [Kaistia sp. 32K]
MKALGSPETSLEARAEQALAAFSVVNTGAATYEPAMPAVASPSYHAVESRTFAVAPAGAEATHFLRLGLEEVADLADGETAFAAARRLHALGFSPEVMGHDPGTGSMLFARLGEGWRAARIDDLIPEARVTRLIAMQKAIGQGEPFGRPWSVFDGVAQLRQILGDDVDLPDDVDWMLAWMASIREAIEASGVDLKPAHGDPHSSNVMLGPDGAMQLVDFDMAGDVDPYYQLGAQMNELYQFDSQMKPLLEMHDGAFSERAFNRCRAYAAADDLYWALRSLVLELRSPRRGVEFLKYAGWRFLRCRMLLGHPDFEGRLRTL